jgi:dolichol-phosphate mannosyltransferase
VSTVDTAKRIGRGALKPENWAQLIKFGAVGGSGYVINLIVFGILNEALGVHHLLAAVGAFCVAVSNNFFWNRHWTFAAGEGHAGFQAARFLVISVGGLVINLIALELLVNGGLSGVPAQAIAVGISMPFNFIGNKLWTFAKG